MAIKEGNKELVELFLAEEIEGFGVHGTNSIFVEQSLPSCLHRERRVKERDLDSARMLVAFNAEVNVITERENSPFDLSCKTRVVGIRGIVSVGWCKCGSMLNWRRGHTDYNQSI